MLMLMLIRMEALDSDKLRNQFVDHNETKVRHVLNRVLLELVEDVREFSTNIELKQRREIFHEELTRFSRSIRCCCFCRLIADEVKRIR